MSELEQVVKPSLKSLILDEEILLTKGNLLNIAEWTVMTAYVREFEDVRTKAISITDIDYLRQNKVPPNNWNIYIGRHIENDYKLRSRHSGHLFALRNQPYPITPSGCSSNVQYTTFGIGNLVIHASSTSLSSKAVKEIRSSISRKIIKIWPLTFKKDINLKEMPYLTLTELDNLANTGLT
jgi:hypothetical protein